MLTKYLSLEGCHVYACDGHFAGDVTERKALTYGYWWPKMFYDARQYVHKFDPCQRVGRPSPTSAMPLVPICVLSSFEKWGIDLWNL